jgi:hypothetical protein
MASSASPRGLRHSQRGRGRRRARFFALSEDGDTFVIRAGDEFKVEGKNSLDEMCMATPAIARGSLIIRTATKHRIGRTDSGLL